MNSKIQRGASKIPQAKVKKQKNKIDYNHMFMKFVSTSIIILTLVLFYELWIYIIKPVVFKPIANVHIISQSNEVDNQSIEKIVSEYVENNSIFTISVYSLMEDIQNTPWVKDVSFNRKYPDLIEIKIDYQKPIARWGENELLSDGNNIYSVSNIDNYNNLPVIYTNDTNKKNILNQYKVFNIAIKPLNHNIQSLTYSETGTSTIVLDNGVKINLGKDNYVERIQNLIAIYNKELVNNFNTIDYIDLRYRQSVAIKFKEKEETKI